MRIEAGKTVKIRLIGVDTPELKWEGLTEEQPGGKEASDYVKSLLKEKKVLLEYDVQKYDRYGRTLVLIRLVSAALTTPETCFLNISTILIISLILLLVASSKTVVI